MAPKSGEYTTIEAAGREVRLTHPSKVFLPDPGWTKPDLDPPDELRIDLDPQPDVPWAWVREVAMCAHDVLPEHGLRGYPKTSGSRGIHVNVRIEPRWDFLDVRRAALALAREVERRKPG